MSRPTSPIGDRLMRHVKKNKKGCWIWTGHLHKHGYGVIQLGGRLNRRVCRTHRVSYEFYVGPIPEGMLVLHKCDDKRCINPEHLELGDYSKNIQDAWDRGLRKPMKSRLNKEDFMDIKTNPKGLPIKELAKLYGISYSYARYIKNYKEV